jgi:hypothetical protein
MNVVKPGEGAGTTVGMTTRQPIWMGHRGKGRESALLSRWLSRCSAQRGASTAQASPRKEQPLAGCRMPTQSALLLSSLRVFVHARHAQRERDV